MKAVILSAGKGSRLKKITRVIPKPMINFKGKPILQYNIELCKKFGIEEIFINTHHLRENIIQYFGEGEKFGVKITYSHEKKLLGTAGALNNFIEYLKDEPFFVIYGDQISGFNLQSLISKYAIEDCIAVVGFHYREDVTHSGVAEFDKNNRVLKFIEKPSQGETQSHWVNAGIYYLNPQIFDFIPNGFSDFGKDIFPELIHRNIHVYGVCEKKDIEVFDTPEMYNKSFSKK